MSALLYISWKEEFTVGAKILDTHHKTLFDLINKLYISMSSVNSQNTTSIVISELNRYAQTHFKEEERIMRESAFPELSLHQEAHRLFVLEVTMLQNQNRSYYSDSSHDVLKFLKEWLINHILHMDRRYKPFIKNENGG
jgi:hemerythrin-like metal-binding protein